MGNLEDNKITTRGGYLLYLLKNLLHIKLMVCCFAYLLIPHTSLSKEPINLSAFDSTAEAVKELTKTDLRQAHLQLSFYNDHLDSLTIEQNLVYYKLLTEIQIEQNKYSLAKITVQRGLTIARRLASPSILISELLYLKGFAYESLDDFEEATNAYKKGLNIATSLHHNIEIASGLINLGAVAYLTDDYERSLVLLNDAYKIAGKTDDEELKGTANSELGNVYSRLLQNEQSMIYYQQSYLHFKKAGMLLSAQKSLTNIALHHLQNENYQDAIRVFDTIITEFDDDTPSDTMFNVYSSMAWAYLHAEDNDPESAYQYITLAKRFLPFTEKVTYRMRFYFDEANVLYQLERFDEALNTIDKAEQLWANQFATSPIKKQTYLVILDLRAKVFFKQKKFEQAYQIKLDEIPLTDELYKNEDNRSITQVRLSLEAKQEDKQNEILNNQRILYEANLHEATLESNQQRIYLAISALLALGFTGLLIRLLHNQYQLQIANKYDPLTGVMNRHFLIKRINEAVKLAQIKGNELSVLMINIDSLKQANEALGYQMGDEVIVKISAIIVRKLQVKNLLGRFDGDTFMAILPSTLNASAIEIAEAIRSSVNTYVLQTSDCKSTSVSIGVASLEHGNNVVDVIKKAEELLLQAKIAGKNKVFG
jgi:diguanylate cyclase (GGDEF)-like protein